MTGLNPVWHRMFYSCTRMATWASKGLNRLQLALNDIRSYQIKCMFQQHRKFVKDVINLIEGVHL